MTYNTLQHWFDRIDERITRFMAGYGMVLLRLSIGIIFLWFGGLKLIEGASPAEDLIQATVTFISPDWFIPFLAVWEILIGLGFITGRYLRLTILLLFCQMPGTFLPIIVRPDLVFTTFPVVLTMEGQYIIKNIVVISSALVIGATLRHKRLLKQREQ
ncbi:MAG: DoxX family membrane protein [Chloroflexi bacterium AL-W]|nr:DoxX family membrane protein [Chloroflexi bacterium AL-N1]NOK65424.1 DoxX family membrane protein [Chloroflexi bacterium AL-N10]NOK72310.1 DoxX family membrane protein [Chloroflexi bacterium AL-N5]NOK79603.1 DoxX family membrane protein [Chloroflexi bacterium AL-W]NOK87519.1 DoxX family membrane protein [Chloroflexi bacterium AL-N15]